MNPPIKTYCPNVPAEALVLLHRVADAAAYASALSFAASDRDNHAALTKAMRHLEQAHQALAGVAQS